MVHVRDLRYFVLPLFLAVVSGASTLQAQALQPHALAVANDSPDRVQSGTEASPPVVVGGLLIGVGDLLQVSVFGAQEYNNEVRVSDTGDISLPLIGAVHVGGLSITDAERVVAKQLAKGGFFNNPQVAIIEKQYATQGIAVLGEAQKPGIYPLLGPHTLFEAISAAGGTTPKAGNTVVISHHNRQYPPETVALAYDANHIPGANVLVFPGDTIVVSKAGVVYVVGDVHTPTGVIMENANLTVLQAIAMAQGTNSSAALDRAKLIRKTSTGQMEIPIPLKKILAAQQPDIPLQANDILFVPDSAAKSAGRRGLEAVVQAATGIVIYRRN